MKIKRNYVAILLTMVIQVVIAQNEDAMADIKKFQDELNSEYKNAEKSPLLPKDRKKFEGHDFFAVDLKYRVIARIDRDVDRTVFKMKTSTSRTPNYRKYGLVKFQIDGKEFVLTLYESMDLKKDPKYSDYLFLPFTDLTTGKETYGGGRYLDLRIPKGDEIIIDFNKAYNPYCAYSHLYSCPKVPDENQIDVEIKAGVRLLNEH